MSYSISLNNFKKVAAVATFLAAATCLVPAPSEAAKYSGVPDCDVFNFTLDNSGAILDAVLIQNGDCDDVTDGISGTSFYDFDSRMLTYSKLGDKGYYTATLSGTKRNSASLEPASIELKFELLDLSVLKTNNPFLTLIELLNNVNPNPPNIIQGSLINFQSATNEPLSSKYINPKTFTSNFKVIPEPSTTVSLLGIGALGAVLTLKRRKYLQ